MRDIDMSTKYDPTAVEAGRYDHWQEKKLFAPESNEPEVLNTESMENKEPAPSGPKRKM